jgi:acyl carrier protein
VAPRNGDEQKIAEIWQEALGIDRVGIHDHFFELGGNSLIGMLIVSRLQREFQVQLSAASLFEGPTISLLLDLIKPNRPATPVLEQNSARGKLRRERLRRQKRHVETAGEE